MISIIIINNLILAINDYDAFEEINSLNIKDNLYLARINIAGFVEKVDGSLVNVIRFILKSFG